VWRSERSVEIVPGIKVRQLLGKYRVERRLALGGFATVFQAHDTIEGISVALKIPHPHFVSKAVLETFRKEVRVNARLDHPNILPIKNAGFVDEQFVIVYPLGACTLGDRLRRRLAARTALRFAEQMLEAVAYAHARRIMHLDVKPDNFIVFEKDRLRLADFGIARVAQKTVNGSALGTIGYIAPEQAMGKASLRSDVFALGLIMYRMFSGELPEWPFEWPGPGYPRLRRSLHPQFISLIRRAMAIDHRARFADARQMLAAFRRVKPRALKSAAPGGRGSHASVNGRARRNGRTDWKAMRIREFRRRYGTALGARHACEHCGDPVAEHMQACPWCGTARETHVDATAFPCRCPRCKRGMKLDWRFCPWCYGPAIGPRSARRFTDRRYASKCANAGCEQLLMPFMRYCPSCRQKIKRSWPMPPPAPPHQNGHVGERCPHCRHGVLREFWSHCPWCAKALDGVRR
jgi:eukaryotic-like serine/threonine-protein kinase